MSDSSKYGLGGLMQIRAGWKSLKLTNNPEITYFEFKYSRHFCFAIESVKSVITGNITANSTVSSIISRKLGDLAYKTWLEFDLPTVSSTTDVTDADSWIANNNYKLNDTITGISSLIIEPQGSSIPNITRSATSFSTVSSAISNDGTQFIIGSPFNNGQGVSSGGDVKIFNYDSSTQNITQEFISYATTSVDSYGHAVAMNDAGDVVAVGAKGANGNAGYCRTFKKISGSWYSLPELINITPNENFGSSVALNGDGTILAVGAPYAIVNLNLYAGYVKVYEYNGTTWIQKGSTITGSWGTNEIFGQSLDFNQTGDRIFIGGPLGNASDTGVGYVFDWNGSDWVSFGNNVNGPAGAQLGNQISCNSAGTRFAIESFKSRGLNIQRHDDPLQPGEWRDVDAPGGRLTDSFMTLPYKEPSGTLANLLGALVTSGKQFASTIENPTGDGNSEAPVGTTVALMEKGQRIMSAIHKRLHYAQKTEFKILKRIFAEYLPEEYPYEVQGASSTVFKQDFDDSVDIIPVSDPNIFSTTQRITLAQTQLQLAQSAPELHDLREAYRKMYLALNIKNIDAILPEVEEIPARDPISEQQAALTGNPIKAVEFQNHEAYIAAHSSFLQNPMVAQNPSATQSIGANIQERQAMLYRQQIQQVLGRELPSIDEELSPEVMNEIAIAAAQATQVVTGQAQAMAEAQARAQADPQVEMFQQQLQLEKEQLAQKENEDIRDKEVELTKAQINAQVEREKLSNKTAIDIQKLEAQTKKDLDKDFLDTVKTLKDLNT